MHSMQLLLKQPLQSGLRIARPTCPRSRLSLASFLNPKKPSPSSRNPASRDFSICLRCQFRSQSKLSSLKEENDPSLQSDRNNGSIGTTPGPDKGPSSVAFSEDQRDAPFERSQDTQAAEGTNKSNDSYLPSEFERRRSQLSKKFTTLMDNLQSNVFLAGQRINDLTGYSGIESLKRDIEAQENQVREARSIVRQTKDAYSAAINRRSTSQREVNELLQRKHAWSTADLERFTSLYRSDHANEVSEIEAQESLTKAENELEEATAKLNRSILSRYHEEQIWSDKIRRMSTWGTWGLMGVNVLLFLVFQILVEPWRRRRLVKGFEEKVKEAIETEAVANRAIVAGLARAAEAGADAFTGAAVPAAESPVFDGNATDVSATDVSVADVTLDDNAVRAVSSPTGRGPEYQIPEERAAENEKATLSSQLSAFLPVELWQQTIKDGFSDRHVVLTQRDLTTMIIQSAAIPATILGVAIALLQLRG